MVAFALLAIAGFGPWMGVNGVLVRYLFPFASLLLGHRDSWMDAVAQKLRRIVGWRRDFSLIADVCEYPSFSRNRPGIRSRVAQLRRADGARATSESSWCPLSRSPSAALLCWLFLPAAYYGTLLRFSEGANNLPLLPAPHLLLYILTLFLIVPPLLAVSVRKPQTGDISSAAICGALGILCVVMSPGALGRCDPPHVLFYGMGASMLLMIRLANISRRVFAAYAIAYAFVSIFLIEVVNLVVFYGMSPKRVISRHPSQIWLRDSGEPSSTVHPDANDAICPRPLSSSRSAVCKLW